MAVKSWHQIKFCYCHHINQEVSLEVEVVYPAEWLPDQNPRILAHRCSEAQNCNLMGRPGCLWAGTNPTVDPFI